MPERPGVRVEVQDESAATVTGSRADPSAPVLAISGELDLASVDSVRKGIEPYLSARPDRMVFDLSGLGFMDSSGIALLVQVANRVDRVELTGVSPIVRRVLEATGLDAAFGWGR